MQRRYAALVNCHMQSTPPLAAGIHAVPDISPSFATTLAAHRFLNNERVTLPALAEPLIESVRQEAPRECERFLLVAHDWSQLMYPGHRSKQDRVRLSSRGEPDGYELQTALAISDRDGSPLAPLAMSLRAADGVHCSRACQPRQALSPLDELGPTMRSIEARRLPLPAVHIIDAEADSVAHFREWSGQPNRWYLVRADDRLVEHQSSRSALPSAPRSLTGSDSTASAKCSTMAAKPSNGSPKHPSRCFERGNAIVPLPVIGSASRERRSTSAW